MVAGGVLVGALPPDPPRRAGRWTKPVDGAVVDPFRAPANPYGPGNRGIDLAAPPGTPVRAAGAGVVSFAGPVGGTLHVVVAHAGGLRTTYSFLSDVGVRAASRVARGQVVGSTGGGGPGQPAGAVHFGLRLGDRYVDPSVLFGPCDLTKIVHLAPVDQPVVDRGPRPWGGPAPPGALTRAIPPGAPERAGGTLPRTRSAGKFTRSPITTVAASAPQGRRAGGRRSQPREILVAVVTMKQLLEAGVHFGHQTRRWNPKMRRFIFGERNGIYIIDLQQTLERIDTAYQFIRTRPSRTAARSCSSAPRSRPRSRSSSQAAALRACPT